MKALVTGGAGFIGSNISKQLLNDGHEVVILDDLSSGYQINIDQLPDAYFIQGDIRDEAALLKAVTGVEVVFHCAASVGNKRSIDYPVLDADINVLGTIKLLEAARKAGVRKIVSASSAGIFGELKILPIKEDHPIDPASPYSVSKLCSEKACLAYAKLYDMEAVCLRYFNVYGANQRFDAYGNVIPIFVFNLLQGKPITVFGDGEQTRDFVEIRDVVQANIKAALSVGVSGAFNIASSSQISINKLITMLHEVSDIKTEVIYGDERPGDVRDSLADINFAHESFGFQPEISLDMGLPDYVAWAKSEVA